MSWKISLRYIYWCWAGPYGFCDSQHALWRWFMWCGCSRLPENVACRVEKRSKTPKTCCHYITSYLTMSKLARPPAQDLCPAGTASKTQLKRTNRCSITVSRSARLHLLSSHFMIVTTSDALWRWEFEVPTSGSSPYCMAMHTPPIPQSESLEVIGVIHTSLF